MARVTENILLPRMRRLRLALLVVLTSSGAVTPLLAEPSELPSSRWQLVAEKGANASMESELESEGQQALLISVTKPGQEFWSVELRAPGVVLQKGKTYELKFRAKSDAQRFVYFVVERNSGDQASVAAGTTLQLSPKWTDCTVDFEIDDDAADGRLTISSLSVDPSKFWFSDFRFGER